MKYSIIVNTCDSYSDCWDPFFKLFSVFWKDCKGKIFLNTEYKDYSFPGLDIIPTKVCEKRNFPKDKRNALVLMSERCYNRRQIRILSCICKRITS